MEAFLKYIVSFLYNFNEKLIHGKAERYCRDKGMKLYRNWNEKIQKCMALNVKKVSKHIMPGWLSDTPREFISVKANEVSRIQINEVQLLSSCF